MKPAYLLALLLLAGVCLAEEGVPLSGATARRNVLDDPGFDLGGRAWRYFPWYQVTDGLPTFDEQVKRDGCRSLHFPGMGESVESRLYLLPIGKPVTLSAWVRADLQTPHKPSDRAFSMFLLTAAWKMQALDVQTTDVGPEWRRFSLTFTPTPSDRPYGASVFVRFDANIPLWLDSIQLEAGATPTDYDPGPQIGIDSALSDNTTTPGPLAMTIHARRTQPAESRARVTVVDVRGTVGWTSEVDLGMVGPDASAIPVQVLLSRLGVAEIRVALLDHPGVTATATLASAALRIAVTDGTALTANPLVGIDNNPLMHLAARLADRERWSSLLGAGCSRFFFSCTNGTRTAMEEDSPEFLAIARQLLTPEFQHHRQLTTCLSPPHDSALDLERMRKANRVPAESEIAPAIAKFAEKASRIASAMQGSIGCYEILNEPNIWYIDGKRVMDAERMAQVIAGVAPAITAAAPGTRIAANINGVDPDYLTSLLRAPSGKLIDLVTIHPYRATPESPALYEDLLALRTRIDQVRPGLPIVATEQYFLSREDGFCCGEYARTYAAEYECDQAGRSVQAALHHIAALATPYVFFQPDDDLYRQAPQGVHWFFAATMVRQLSKMLEGVQSGSTVAVHPACRVFLFRTAEGTITASITTREYERNGRVTIPTGASASDCDGNPVSGEVRIDYLPTWIRFPVGTSVAAATAALQGAGWRGFDFPWGISAAQAGSDLVLTTTNRGAASGAGQVTITAAPAGWPSGKVSIPTLTAGATNASPLHGLPALTWDAPAFIHWSAECDGLAANGATRIPTLHIPRLSAAWPDSAWIELGEAHVSKDFSAGARPHHGTADLAARIALGWNDEGLQLSLEVRDDVYVRGTQNDGDLWQGDSFQLYVDPADAAREGRIGFTTSDACWLFGEALAGGTAVQLTHNPGNRYLGAANAEQGADPDVRAIWTRTHDGWMLSTHFPAKTLPGLALKAGSRFGLSALINDNDGQGRKAGLTMGAPGTEPYEQPWLWKAAVLDP